MRTFPLRRFNYAAGFVFFIMAVTLSGCFQSANDSISPTQVNLTSIAPLQAATDTPFITPISTGGFTLPTDDPNSFLTATPTENVVVPPPSDTPQVSVPTQDTSQQNTVPTQEPPTAVQQVI